MSFIGPCLVLFGLLLFSVIRCPLLHKEDEEDQDEDYEREKAENNEEELVKVDNLELEQPEKVEDDAEHSKKSDDECEEIGSNRKLTKKTTKRISQSVKNLEDEDSGPKSRKRGMTRVTTNKKISNYSNSVRDIGQQDPETIQPSTINRANSKRSNSQRSIRNSSQPKRLHTKKSSRISQEPEYLERSNTIKKSNFADNNDTNIMVKKIPMKNKNKSNIVDYSMRPIGSLVDVRQNTLSRGLSNKGESMYNIDSAVTKLDADQSDRNVKKKSKIGVGEDLKRQRSSSNKKSGSAYEIPSKSIRRKVVEKRKTDSLDTKNWQFDNEQF